MYSHMKLPLPDDMLLSLDAPTVAAYLIGHRHGYWDAERLKIGDEAAGILPGERP